MWLVPERFLSVPVSYNMLAHGMLMSTVQCLATNPKITPLIYLSAPQSLTDSKKPLTQQSQMSHLLYATPFLVDMWRLPYPQCNLNAESSRCVMLVAANVANGRATLHFNSCGGFSP